MVQPYRYDDIFVQINLVSFYKTFSSKFIRRTSQIYYCINLSESGVKCKRKIKKFYQYLIYMVACSILPIFLLLYIHTFDYYNTDS